MSVGSGGEASNSNWLIPLGMGPTTRESSSWSSCSSSGQETKVSFHSMSFYIGVFKKINVWVCGEILIREGWLLIPPGDAPSLRGAGQSNVTRNW